MGWSGYSLYDGDGTQTLHFNFIEWSGLKFEDNYEEVREWMETNKTKIPNEHVNTFIKGLPKILRKMPKRKVYWTEDAAFEWQMLAALLIDNNIYHEEILDRGIQATQYLMGEHAELFDNPAARRRVLENFITKCQKQSKKTRK